MSQLTKKAIAESFIKLINRMPFDKITVKDIVEDCGVNRNTFYYHYKDIYDLLDQILEGEANRALSGRLTYETWRETFVESCSFVRQNKRGVYHIYNSVSRSQIDKYLYRVIGEIMLEFVRREAGDLPVSEADLCLIAEFYKCAMVGLILQWLDGGLKNDLEKDIIRLSELLEGHISQMLERAVQTAAGRGSDGQKGLRHLDGFRTGYSDISL